ncbi:36148_t:CDS:1, partial [Racocetra persica]
IFNGNGVNKLMNQVQASLSLLPLGLTNFHYRLRSYDSKLGNYRNIHQNGRIYDHFPGNPEQNIIH